MSAPMNPDTSPTPVDGAAVPAPAGRARRWKAPLANLSLVGTRGAVPPSAAAPAARPGATPANWRGRRVRVPTILQMEAVECGAATLAMVLAHHGRHVPLEELRVECGVSRDGSKASNMVKAARRYGLEARGVRKEPAQLRGLQLPMIVHWNFSHFVVLEGFRNGRACLNDPATGPRQVSEEEFDQAFTGVALLFEKGPGFAPGGERRGLMGSLAPRLAGSAAGLLFVVLAGLALVIPGMVGPAYSRVFIDDVLIRGLSTWLRPLLIVMGCTALLQGVLTWLQQHYLLRLETRVALSTSSRFLWHVLRLPVGFFAQRYAGEVSNRVSINDRVARLLSGELATTAVNLVMIAFYAVLMLQYDVVLTVIGVATAGLNLAVLRFTARRRAELSQRVQQDRGKMMGVAMGGLQTLETLKATGSEADFFARWSGHQAKVLNASQHLALTTQVLSAAPPLFLAINTALVLGVGGLRVMDGHLSMGMLMAFQALMLSFVNPVNRLVTLGGTLQEVKADLARLDDVLRAEPDPQGAAAAVAVPDGDGAPARLEGELELRDVSFGYNPLDPPLVDGLSLRLRPGARVALVGPSGCGKSTIARLVAGLYPVRGGEILFDGRPRAQVPPEVLAGSVAVVDQDVFLFEGTVRDNLAMWDDTVADAALVQAARDACIHEEVAARLGGYHGRVEEGGRNFSGGQRQRLEIARALVGSPSVLVLDEATSALDAATEKAIDDHLRRRGCTCLIVAHRLSTIRDCDEILVLDRGKVVQRGTHDEMAHADGPYRDLIALE
ncbi:MAG TPA: NHLP family bacteriocin export ABC transporter peptidase/permease/ATPase subunit [Longimicrobium sp.]|nr:NHLP family bacteriocin export ABC transporter peptidase/permease/ATPase subunit [Longimicrobium sp.]